MIIIISPRSAVQSAMRLLTGLLAAGTSYSVYASEIQWGGYHETVRILYYLCMSAAVWNFIAAGLAVTNFVVEGRSDPDTNPGLDPESDAEEPEADSDLRDLTPRLHDADPAQWPRECVSGIDKILPLATALTLAVNVGVHWTRQSTSLQAPTRTLIVILITLEILTATIFTRSHRRKIPSPSRTRQRCGQDHNASPEKLPRPGQSSSLSSTR